jgi:tRNA U34 5-carboxymethylaminomethyl modifying GTPase MnmE/TrmE
VRGCSDAAQARAAFAQLEGALAGEIRPFEKRVSDLTARLEASVDFPQRGLPLPPTLPRCAPRPKACTQK